jgi:hypothetical protein
LYLTSSTARLNSTPWMTKNTSHDHEGQLAPPEQDVVKTKGWLVVAHPDLLTLSERVLHNTMEVLGRQMQFLIGQNEQMMGGLVKGKYNPWIETGKKARVTKAAGAKKDAIAFKAWLSKAAMGDDNPDGDRSHPALTRLADLDDGAATELYIMLGREHVGKTTKGT